MAYYDATRNSGDKVGDVLTLTQTFTNSAGTATDPSDVTLELKDPSGNTATYTYSLAEITKDSTGVYSKTLPVFDETGWWIYEWQGTGALPKVTNGRIYVEAQAI